MEKINRREVLFGTAAVVSTTGISYSIAKPVEGLLSKNKLEYSDTVLETGLVAFGEGMLATLLTSLNIDCNNAALSGESKKEVLSSRKLEILLTGPLKEEALLRLLPGLISKSWFMGLITSVAFALMHNVVEPIIYVENDGVRLDLDSDNFDFSKVPLTHFLSGIFYWYLMKERGFSHSLLGHSQHNSAAMVALALGVYFDDGTGPNFS